jgi:hypothetical protein
VPDYAWLLDPFYRVLEVYFDGEPVLKGHVLPLVIRGRPALAIDAIEVVPPLRDIIGGKPNPYLSDRLFQHRKAVLEALFTQARSLAGQVGAETLYVDKFSSARWVREAVDLFPRTTYHVRDVFKPFGTEPVAALVREILGGDFGPVCEEIQATNLALMDQGLRFGFKEIGVIDGDVEDERLAVRGP